MLIRRLLARNYSLLAPRFAFTTSKPTKLDYYKVLGLQRTASIDEIKESYRKLAMLYHPDVNVTSEYTNEPDAEKFKQVAEAYAVLSHQESRNSYDLLNKQQPERIYSGERTAQDNFYTTRNDTGDVIRQPTKKGGYEEQRRAQLAKQREKYNVDYLGRYKGGLPSKGWESARRSLKGQAIGLIGEYHDSETHLEVEETFPDHQIVRHKDVQEFNNYKYNDATDIDLRWSYFEASVDYNYFKFEKYRTGWRWFRNLILFFFLIPISLQVIAKLNNKNALEKLKQWKKNNPNGTVFEYQGRKIVIGKTGIVKYA